MQIFVHHLNGSQSVVQLEGESSIVSLQQSLGLADGVTFVYNGLILQDLSSVKDLGNVYVSAALDGGKKKKKKKAFTTKKKNKHIHKKVKMHTLKLYSVDGI